MKNNFKKFIQMNDGFQPELIQNARLDGALQMPVIDREKEIRIPKILVPYSKIKYCHKEDKTGCFYEMDVNFSEVVSNPKDDSVLDTLRQCSSVITPDCSVYINAPLCVQMMSIYRSRAIGAFFQSQGFYVIPNIRWGCKATFTKDVLPEPFAFLGVPKHYIVSIGTYGSMKNPEVRKCFKEGLEAMLDYLEPEIVLVYGSMPAEVFSDLLHRTKFIKYDDWTKLCRKGGL